MPVTKQKASIDHVYEAFKGVYPQVPEGEGRVSQSVSKPGEYHVVSVAKLGGLLCYEMDNVASFARRMAEASFEEKLLEGGVNLPPFSPNVGMVVTVSIVELPQESTKED